MADFIESFSSKSLDTAGELAETLVRKTLKSLSDGYYVFSNIGVFSSSGKALGEFDTVVVTPLGGVVVLETKAGSLNIENDGNIYRDYGDKNKNISEQLSFQLYWITKRLRSQFLTNATVPVRHYLVLPTGTIKAEEAFNYPEDRLIDSNNLSNLPYIIEDFNRKIIVKKGSVETQKLVDFFKSTIQSSLDVSNLVLGLESAQKETAAGLSTWVPRISTAAPVIEVEAPAGAGKTRLAVTLLDNAVKENKKAIYLAFHRNNIERLRLTPIASRIRFIGTWYELAREYVDSETNPENLTKEELQLWFNDIAKKLRDKLLDGNILWDTIVVDNAEDFELDWIESLANALTTDGHLYTLRDNFITAKPKPGFNPEDHITIATSETARIGKKRLEEMIDLGIVPASFTTLNPYEGEGIIFHVIQNESFRQGTSDAIKECLKQGFKPHEISVLSAHGKENSKILYDDSLADLKIKRPTFTFNEEGNMIFTEGELYVDTIRRFKGLQAPCVILTELDFDEYNERAKETLYLAASRASVRFVVVIAEKSFNLLSH